MRMRTAERRRGRGGGTGHMEACARWGSGSDFKKLCR